MATGLLLTIAVISMAIYFNMVIELTAGIAVVIVLCSSSKIIKLSTVREEKLENSPNQLYITFYNVHTAKNSVILL